LPSLAGKLNTVFVDDNIKAKVILSVWSALNGRAYLEDGPLLYDHSEFMLKIILISKGKVFNTNIFILMLHKEYVSDLLCTLIDSWVNAIISNRFNFKGELGDFNLDAVEGKGAYLSLHLEVKDLVGRVRIVGNAVLIKFKFFFKYRKLISST
jgi:hypothetical protein